MRSIRALLLRINGLLHREQRERELTAEIESHLQMQIEANTRSGMTPTEARRAALIQSGGIEAAKEAYRDRRGLPSVERFLQDCRYALRVLRQSPGFTLTALMTLALGIGANTAIFSLLDAFLFRPLPVKDPQELIVVRRDFPYSTFEQFRDRNHTLSGMFAYDGTHVSVTIDGKAEYVDGDFVSGNYFDVLGVAAIAGRTLRPDDDQPGKPPVTVIAYRYWEERFSREPSVIGKTIYLGGTAFTIIGVTPPGFSGRKVAGKSADLLLPMSMQHQLALKDHDTVGIMGRLNPGVSMEQARVDLDVIQGQILTQAADGANSPRVQRAIRERRIELLSGLQGTSDTNSKFVTELRILGWVVAMALLIVCVNVANLLLSRATGRRREIAVRLALGAGRGRLIRQLLTESVVLAVVGGGLGLIVAKAGLGFLLTVLSYGQGPVPFDLSLDGKILVFTCSVSLLTGILFGFAPALATTRVNLIPTLKGNEHGAAPRLVRRCLANSLVVLQVALSLVLLIATGLMIRSLQMVHEIDLGYQRERVLVTWIFPVLSGYDHAKELALYRELLERTKAIPGVSSSSVSRFRMSIGGAPRNVRPQSSAGIADQFRQARCSPVGPRFFETMGIGLVLGREFSPADSETAPKVAVISEAMARNFFPNQNPVGLHFGFGRSETSGDIQVVGVVKDIRRLFEEEPLESVYIPYTQADTALLGQMNLMIRTTASPAAVIASLRREMQSIDGNLPLVDLQTQADEIDYHLGAQRSLATLLSIFGTLALVLTSIGLFGTMSDAVGRRTKELGIRLALGARKESMLWMIFRQALSLVVIGLAIGMAISAVATRLIGSLLFSVTASDPIAISFAVLGMFATAALAAYFPARRATRVDPMVALRYE